MTAAEIKRRRREMENARRCAALEKSRARPSDENRVVVPLRQAGDDDWHRRIHLQNDQRDLTAKIMGDPPTGRSALDLRREP